MPPIASRRRKKVHSLPSRKREYKRRSWSWWCRKRRGERWRRVSSGEAWNLVALGVHALLVGDVVTSLDSPRSSIARVSANRAACEQAGTGADSRSWSRTTKGCADRSTCCGPQSGAGSSPGDRAVLCRLLWRNPNLLLGVMPAQSLFAYEKIEGLSGRRHHCNAWPQG